MNEQSISTPETREREVVRLREEAQNAHDACTILHDRIAVLTAQLTAMTQERDLAIAHDTQPYPTQWAYDQACKALEKCKQQLAASVARVKRLEEELSKCKNAKINRDGFDSWVHEADSAILRDLLTQALHAERGKVWEEAAKAHTLWRNNIADFYDQTGADTFENWCRAKAKEEDL